MELPSNRDAELGIIGACFDGGLETSLVAVESVPAKAFYHEDLRLVFEFVETAVKSGTAPDAIGLFNWWKRAAVSYAAPVDALSAQDRFAAWHLEASVSEVRDCYQRRSAILAADLLMRRAQDFTAPISQSIADCEAAIAPQDFRAPPIVEPKVLAARLTDDLERRFNLQGALSGIATGFPALDKLTDGLQRGELWIIGARPNVGKTSLSLNISERVSIQDQIPLLFVTLEMSALALSRRLLSMNAPVNASDIRRGSFPEPDFKRMIAFNARLKAAPFYVLDSPGGIRITQLCHSIRAAIRRWKIQVVVLDYLQKIRPDAKGEKRTYEIGDTTSVLVELVKRENVNLLALAQLNREPEKNAKRPPILSDLADSKSIEADADFVGLLERPVGDDQESARLHVAKQRDGERGIVPMRFKGWHCRFEPDYENH